MKSSVIIFPGSNCDRDMDVALKKFGFKNQMVWHNDEKIPKSDLIVLPGGFSYGDYLRCGSIAGKSKTKIDYGPARMLKGNFRNRGNQSYYFAEGVQLKSWRECVRLT